MWEPLIRMVERLGSLVVLVYLVAVWMPQTTAQLQEMALNQAKQTIVLERLVDSVEKLDERIKP